MSDEHSDQEQEAINRECMEALAAARAYVKLRAPYVTDTLYSLIPKLIPKFGNIMTTNRHVMLLGPEFFLEAGSMKSFANEDKVPAEQRADAVRGGLLFHEMSHLLRDMERINDLLPSGDRSSPAVRKAHKLLNQAFDIAINDSMIDAGWLLPEWGCFSSRYGFPKGLTGEQYYELLKQKQPPDDKCDEEEEGGEEEGGEEGEPRVGSGGCGSCAGNDGDSEEQEIAAQADREIGRSQTECDRIVRETAKAIRKHDGGRGDIPLNLLQNLPPDAQKSILPWKAKLANITRRIVGKVVSGQHDFSRARISKRSFTRGITRPGMISRKPNVLFIEDSSGSMGLEQLQSSRREQTGVMQQCGISEVWFMDADAAVASPPRRVHTRDLVTLPVHGGGGTNFAPALAAAEKLNPRPDIVFYFTDGDGYAPEAPPRNMEVVWVIVPSPWGRAPASWGHLVVVSDDAAVREPYENK